MYLSATLVIYIKFYKLVLFLRNENVVYINRIYVEKRKQWNTHNFQSKTVCRVWGRERGKKEHGSILPSDCKQSGSSIKESTHYKVAIIIFFFFREGAKVASYREGVHDNFNQRLDKIWIKIFISFFQFFVSMSCAHTPY